MKAKRVGIMVAALGLALFVFSGVSFAQADTIEEVPPGIERNGQTPGNGLHKGWEQGQHKGWDKERLDKLKEENPEAFKQEINERRAKVKGRLEELKQGNPEKYQQVMQDIRKKELQRLQQLRQDNPEKFRETIEQRKAGFQDRLETLKAEDPKKYERITEHQQQLGELRRLEQENPEEHKEFLQNHPQLRQRLENIHDRVSQGGQGPGVRDHSAGQGAGPGQGGMYRPEDMGHNPPHNLGQGPSNPGGHNGPQEGALAPLPPEAQACMDEHHRSQAEWDKLRRADANFRSPGERPISGPVLHNQQNQGVRDHGQGIGAGEGQGGAHRSPPAGGGPPGGGPQGGGPQGGGHPGGGPGGGGPPGGGAPGGAGHKQ